MLFVLLLLYMKTVTIVNFHMPKNTIIIIITTVECLGGPVS